MHAVHSHHRRASFPALVVLLSFLAATGCVDLFVGPEGEYGRLSLSFRLEAEDGTSTSASADASSRDALPGPRLSTTITDTGGSTLVLHDVRVVVGEFALERELGGCTTSDGADTSGCETFVAEPHLLQVSLGEIEQGEAIRVSESAPADAYEALEFGVRVPEESLLAEIRQEGADVAQANPDRPKLAFDDWPEGATAFVSGVYDVDGETGSAAPVPFRIFFSGEAGARIEFQQDFPLMIRGGETTEAAVVMSRDVWRASEDQQVLDLSQLDYDETGQVYTLDASLIDGFETVEVTS